LAPTASSSAVANAVVNRAGEEPVSASVAVPEPGALTLDPLVGEAEEVALTVGVGDAVASAVTNGNTTTCVAPAI
jgi:hypothetical protein